MFCVEWIILEFVPEKNALLHKAFVAISVVFIVVLETEKSNNIFLVNPIFYP